MILFVLYSFHINFWIVHIVFTDSVQTEDIGFTDWYSTHIVFPVWINPWNTGTHTDTYTPYIHRNRERQTVIEKQRQMEI